jgi:hypothetical protein
VSLPGWELAASAYATTLQPDYDAGWADDASVGASVRAPSLSFETKTVTSPQLPVAALPEEAHRGGPQFGSRAPVTAPVPAPFAKDDAAKQPAQPRAERAPLWTPADAPPVMPQGVDAQVPWRTLITLLVLALLAGVSYRAYPRARDWWVGRSVPSELRAYIAGDGVPYAPTGEGYSVRLPEVPVHTDVPRNSLSAPWVAIHRSVVARDDYRIVVRVAPLSRGGALPFGAAGMLGDRRIAGDVAATNVREVTFAGRPAFDYEGGRERPLRGRIFLRGARLYVVTVESAGAGHVFDELMRSFTPAAA